MMDIGLYNTQLLAYVFMVLVHEVVVFRKWLKARRDPSPTTLSGRMFPSPWVRAKHIVFMVKRGMTNLPTKMEILNSPMIQPNYSMLLNPYEYIVFIVKRGMTDLPTKMEILNSPMIQPNYSYLQEPV